MPPEPPAYPADYILDEIRQRAAHRDRASVQSLYDSNFPEIVQAAFSKYEDAGGDVSPEVFRDAAESVFGGLLYPTEEGRANAQIRTGLGATESKPTGGAISTWKTRERVSGYLFQLQMLVDMGEPDDEGSLMTNVFYSLRSRDLISYGRMKRLALADFEGETDAEGSFPGQPILGAVVTGVYQFERTT